MQHVSDNARYDMFELALAMARFLVKSTVMRRRAGQVWGLVVSASLALSCSSGQTGSPSCGAPELSGASLEAARSLAQGALGQDVTGDRHEFISLLSKARALSPTPALVARTP